MQKILLKINVPPFSFELAFSMKYLADPDFLAVLRALERAEEYWQVGAWTVKVNGSSGHLFLYSEKNASRFSTDLLALLWQEGQLSVYLIEEAGGVNRSGENLYVVGGEVKVLKAHGEKGRLVVDSIESGEASWKVLEILEEHLEENPFQF